MSAKATRATSPNASTRCDEFLSIPVPLTLKNDLHRLAVRDCCKVAATARRLLARSVERELEGLALGVR